MDQPEYVFFCVKIVLRKSFKERTDSDVFFTLTNVSDTKSEGNVSEKKKLKIKVKGKKRRLQRVEKENMFSCKESKIM